MNRVIEAILSRRSRREGFSPAPVPAAVVEEIVRCGLAAPSSKNARPWRFHVVTGRALRDELAGLVERSSGVETYVPFDPALGGPRPGFSSTVLESAAVLRSAPVAIFVENRGVFGGGRRLLLQASPDGLASSIVGYTFEVMGIGAAVENMWLAAVAHGLDGVFMGDVLIAEREIGRRLSVDGDLVGVLALGYPEDRTEPPGRASGELAADRIRWY